jgi:small-conductance mechanosensitive channel
MKTKNKKTVITIDSDLHEEIRKYCEDNGIKIGFLATQALRKMIDGKRVTQEPRTSSASNA